MLREIFRSDKRNTPLEKPIAFAVVGVLAVYILHFGFLSFLNSPWDFDHLAGYYEIAWRFWQSQSFPAGFNPFIQGGRSLGGDPQIFLYSPWTLVAGIFSPLVAVKWQLLFEALLGAWGLSKLLQFFKCSRPEILWGLFLFLSCGAVTAKMATGHATLGFVFFFPLLFWISLRFEKRIFFSHRLFFGYLVLFIYLGNHKPNFFIYGLPPLFCEALIRSILNRSVRPIFLLTMASGTAVLVNAASLLPSRFYFHAFPRHDADEWVPIPIYSFFLNLMLPLRALPEWSYGQRFLQRHEYNIFLGPGALVLAWMGWKSLQKRSRTFFLSLSLTSLLFFWVGIGSTPTGLNPYHFLYYTWPGFNSVRVPTRFWIIPAFTFLLYSVFGLRFVEKTRVFLIFALLPLFLSALVNISKPTFESKEHRISVPRTYPSSIEWVDNDIRYQLDPIREGKGVLNSIENMAFVRSSALKPGDALAYNSSTPVHGIFRWDDWSHIVFEIEAAGKTIVSLNLNGHPYWTTKAEGVKVVPRDNGALTLEVERGKSIGTLEFKQPMAYEGLVVTILSLGLVLLYGVWVILGGRKKSEQKVIGLTGGIGSGKSSVAAFFREEGIPVIDLDKLGRELLEKDRKTQNKVQALFGTLDRQRIREIVFSDPEKKRKLEKVLHPLIWKAFAREARVQLEAGNKVILCEAALLIENGGMDRLDGLIVVMADESVRKKRLIERDHISEDLANQMLKAQTTDAERRQYATYLIENQAGFYDLKEKVKAFLKQL